jgi:hypothetical protein
MSVEALVSLGAAWAARSPALLGFGGDSAVELLSAAVVLWRFFTISSRPCGTASCQNRRRFALSSRSACCHRFYRDVIRPRRGRPSPIGIVLLILAAVVMPWLARRKRQLSIATASAALRADAAESSICGYLALIALAVSPSMRSRT